MKRGALLALLLPVTALAFAEAELPLGAKPELAVIEAPQALSRWAEALQSLSKGARSTVSVCHFGDSHLQSGQMDGVLRQIFQARYGDAGRGYVFPYEALNTDSTQDVGSSTDALWQIRRMMGERSGGPVGPGGLAALCEQANFVLTLDTHGEKPSPFDRVRVLFAPGPDRAELWVATRPRPMAYALAMLKSLWRERRVVEGDTLSEIAAAEDCTVADLKRWNGANHKLKVGGTLRFWSPPPADEPRLKGFTIWGVLEGKNAAGWTGMPVDLGSEGQQVFVLGAQSSEEQTRAEILGLVLERRRGQGLFWHSLAANGAQAKHFSAQKHLDAQLKSLAPDLIVVSLGTNETQQLKFDLNRVLAQERQFWQVLRRAAPGAALLITSPPEAKWGKQPSNTRLDPFVAALREAALAEGAAFLDLRAAQGGSGAYGNWAAAGLAGKDGVHYKPSGYRLMGQWLADALQKIEVPLAP